MLELILMVSLSPLTSPMTSQFQPCVWPNKCKTEAVVEVAQFQPCVWPNKCSKKTPAVTVAQFQPCVWPNKCAKVNEANG